MLVFFLISKSCSKICFKILNLKMPIRYLISIGLITAVRRHIKLKIWKCNKYFFDDTIYPLISTNSLNYKMSSFFVVKKKLVLLVHCTFHVRLFNRFFFVLFRFDFKLNIWRISFWVFFFSLLRFLAVFLIIKYDLIEKKKKLII